MFYVGTLWEPLPRKPWKACRNTCLESFTCNLGNLHLGTFTRKLFFRNLYCGTLGTCTCVHFEACRNLYLCGLGAFWACTWPPLLRNFGNLGALQHLYLRNLKTFTWELLGNYLGTTWEPLPWNLGSLYGQTYQTLKPQLANPHVFGNPERTFIWESLPRNLDLGACPGTFAWKPVFRTFTYGALLGNLNLRTCTWEPYLGTLRETSPTGPLL